MSEALSSVAGLVVALVAGLWSGMLVFAQGAAPAGSGAERRGAVAPNETAPDRAAVVARIALLLVAGAAASEALGWWYRPPVPGLARMVVALALVYLIGDAVPRSITVLLPKVAAGMARLARASLLPFAPLLGLAESAGSLIQRLLPAPHRRADRFGKAHSDVLQGVLSLGETTVEEIMTPRLDILAVEAGAEWRDVVDLLGRSDHAKMPVYAADLDNVVGVLYAKDLTPAISGAAAEPSDWRDLIQPAPFVPESKTLTAQLRDFQHGPASLAIVVDEFGGTSGIVTLEDVLEEVVGEIHGEYDVDAEPAVEREGDNRFWVEGGLPLDELSELLGKHVVSEEVSTVGGLVYSELGHVPRPGEEFRLDEFRVVVEQVVRRRVKRVYFERITQATREGPDTDGQE